MKDVELTAQKHGMALHDQLLRWVLGQCKLGEAPTQNLRLNPDRVALIVQTEGGSLLRVDGLWIKIKLSPQEFIELCRRV